MLCIIIDTYGLLFLSYKKTLDFALILQYTDFHAPTLETYKIGMET